MDLPFKGFANPKYTQTPNDLFDILLPTIDNLCEMKVTLIAIRHTLGYHRAEVELSETFLLKSTGFRSHSSCREGIQRCLERGTLELVRPAKSHKPAVYRLRFQEAEPLPEEEGAELKPARPKAKPRQPELFQAAEAQTTDLKNMISALSTVTGMDFNLNFKRLIQPARILLQHNYTPQQVRSLYESGTESWWYHKDWRGKKGQRPSLTNISETIAQALEDGTNEFSSEIRD